jgi:polygalacturonase
LSLRNHGIYVGRGTFTAKDCTFGGRDGISADCSNVTLETCKFIECSGVSIRIFGTSHALIDGCTVDKNGGLFGIKAVALDPSEIGPEGNYVEVRNCTITRSKMHGLRINSALSGTSVSNLYASDTFTAVQISVAKLFPID